MIFKLWLGASIPRSVGWLVGWLVGLQKNKHEKSSRSPGLACKFKTETKLNNIM